MRVKVKLFAVYRERVGTSQLEMVLPEEATVARASQKLLATYPRVAPNASSLVVAVNQEYVDHSFVLHEGDEVAFIPPVSGGLHDRDHHGAPQP